MRSTDLPRSVHPPVRIRGATARICREDKLPALATIGGSAAARRRSLHYPRSWIWRTSSGILRRRSRRPHTRDSWSRSCAGLPQRPTVWRLTVRHLNCWAVNGVVASPSSMQCPIGSSRIAMPVAIERSTIQRRTFDGWRSSRVARDSITITTASSAAPSSACVGVSSIRAGRSSGCSRASSSHVLIERSKNLNKRGSMTRHDRSEVFSAALQESPATRRTK